MLTGFVQDVFTAFQLQCVHVVVMQTAAAEHRRNLFLFFFKVSSTVINLLADFQICLFTLNQLVEMAALAHFLLARDLIKQFSQGGKKKI